MKLTPVASPHAVGADIKTTNHAESRNRAINALMGNTGQAAAAPVPNPNSISPEELSAVKAPTEPLHPTLQGDETTTTEPAQVETKAATPTEETPAEDPALSRQYVQLARQEKALRAKQMQQNQAFAKREAELKAREEALSAKDSQYTQGYIQKDLLKNNPLKALAEAGISYDDITQQILNTNPADPRTEAVISRLEAKITELESKNKTAEETRTADSQKQYNAAVNQIRRDVQKLVDSDDTYEAIKSTNSANDVVDLITKTYQEDGILLTNEEAAQMVEDYLIEEAMKITKIGKIKSKLQAGQPVTQTEQEKKPTPLAGQPQPIKTLTNNVSASRPLTARDRAIAAMKGQKF